MPAPNETITPIVKANVSFCAVYEWHYTVCILCLAFRPHCYVTVDLSYSLMSSSMWIYYLSTLLLMDIWAVFILELLWIKLLYIFLYMSVCEQMPAFVRHMSTNGICGSQVMHVFSFTNQLPHITSQGYCSSFCQLASPDFIFMKCPVLQVALSMRHSGNGPFFLWLHEKHWISYTGKKQRQARLFVRVAKTHNYSSRSWKIYIF